MDHRPGAVRDHGRMTSIKPLLRPPEAAEALGLTVPEVWRLIRSHRLQHHRLSRRTVLIPARAIAELLAATAVPARGVNDAPTAS